MYHCVSIKAYQRLLKERFSLIGGTKFRLGSVEFDVSGKDGLGGLIEEWFGRWASSEGLAVYNPKLSGNSQTFPDYFVGSNREGLLEVKTFDITASANFDIANFQSYCESLSKNPERLDSDYLIFGYRLNGYDLIIENIWLKKIWEITCPSGKWPLKIQMKRGIIYNIRPATWDSHNVQYPVFPNKEAFVSALYETQKLYLKQPTTLEEQNYYYSVSRNSTERED
ncbi:MAG: NgoBV family restriction endonuclease [Enterobacteriaceae bacterium]|jgi:type II restriction enzyme|nr:NgoBV family restriction endonuclease [Enterobacteriaceae bacterium]